MSSNGRTCGLGPHNGSSSLSVKAKINMSGTRIKLEEAIIILDNGDSSILSALR
jgi:hypothetical protein